MNKKDAIKLMKKIQDPNCNLDSIREKLGVEIPYVKENPSLEDFNLTSEIEDKLKKEENEFKAKYAKNLKYKYCAIVITSFIAGFVIEGVAAAFVGALLGAIFGLMFWIGIDAKRAPQTQERSAYERYLIDKQNYVYWQRKKQKEYWFSLTGHEFEESLGAVYRHLGYLATVTKGSGDFGVDIILEKNGEKTLVQCKAHNKAVGPAVARELYGAMQHFQVNKGILATLIGASKGVHEFIQGKNIIVIDVNDIINMSEIRK